MKTTITLMLMLMFAVGLTAITELVDFNNTNNLTDNFNQGTGTLFSNIVNGGLANSGSVSIPLSSSNIWTHKTGFPVPGVGDTATLSAFFKISGNSGYSGLGFAEENVNQQTNAQVTSSSALGMMFHGGGGGFFNDMSGYSVTWFGTSGDLVLGSWYKIIFTVTNQGNSVFDLGFQIWNSDANGVLGSLFTTQSQTGLSNTTLAGLSTIYPYFTNSGSRSGNMDNFCVVVTEPSTPFSSGEGTVANPYVVTTPGELNEVRNYLYSNFVLGNDIDLDVSPYNAGTGWEPIGGILDNYTVLDLSLATGGSFTISGLGMMGEPVSTNPISIPTDADMIEMMMMEADIMASVSELNVNKFALYEIISLNLESVTGTVNSYDVVSVPFFGTFNGNGKTISNLYMNQPDVFSTGLFGATDGATITDLTLSSVNIDGRRYTGSLVGYGSNTELGNCHFNGNVSAQTAGGGLAGYLTCDVPMEISNCSTSGTVTGTSIIGGLFGDVQNYTISECSSTCSVSGTDNAIGGLLGSINYASIINCFARGAVSSDYAMNLGGLVGWAHTNNLTNCYSTGAVTSNSPYIGGLWGFFYNSTDTGCYWNTVTSGLSNASGNGGGATATGCNTDDMTYPYTAFVGWDFATVWIEDVYPLNGGYPMLRLRDADYTNGNDVTVVDAVVTVTGGDAYIGSGNIPDYSALGLVPVQTFTFIGTGALTITIATTAQHGIYYIAGDWYTTGNIGGLVTLNIDFSLVGKGEVPVVLGNDPATLPVELSSFTAVQTANNYVQLNWVTQSETGVIGYYIYRAAAEDIAEATNVSALITATNTSQMQLYSFMDTDVSPGVWYYWLQNLDMDGSSNYFGPINVSVTNGTTDTPNIPIITALNSVYPNPFNPSTTISFGLAKAEKVHIQIYNMKGQLVRNLVSENKQTGNFRIVWNGTDDRGNALSSGMYFIKMTAGAYNKTTKAVVLK